MAKQQPKSGGDGRSKDRRPKSREDYVKSLHKQIRDDASFVLGFDKDQARGGLLGHYQLGLSAQKIRDFRTDDGTDVYAKHVIKELSEYLDQGSTALYDAMRFCSQYSRAEAEKIAETTMPNGRFPTWNHIRTLFQVKDDAQRKALLMECLAQGWTSTELAKKVAEAAGGRDRGAATVKKPKDFDGLLNQVTTRTEGWLAGNEQVWSTADGSLVAFAEKLPVKDVTPDRLNQVRKAKEDLGLLVAEGRKRIRDADRALTVLEKVLPKK